MRDKWNLENLFHLSYQAFNTEVKKALLSLLNC